MIYRLWNNPSYEFTLSLDLKNNYLGESNV
jgi:hypothetical protein